MYFNWTEISTIDVMNEIFFSICLQWEKERAVNIKLSFINFLFTLECILRVHLHNLLIFYTSLNFDLNYVCPIKSRSKIQTKILRLLKPNIFISLFKLQTEIKMRSWVIIKLNCGECKITLNAKLQIRIKLNYIANGLRLQIELLFRVML